VFEVSFFATAAGRSPATESQTRCLRGIGHR